MLTAHTRQPGGPVLRHCSCPLRYMYRGEQKFAEVKMQENTHRRESRIKFRTIITKKAKPIRIHTVIHSETALEEYR